MALSYNRYVCIHHAEGSRKLKVNVLIGDLGLAQCAAVAGHGTYRPLRRGVRSSVRPDRPIYSFRLNGPINM
jgi:hypothetical protein